MGRDVSRVGSADSSGNINEEMHKSERLCVCVCVGGGGGGGV